MSAQMSKFEVGGVYKGFVYSPCYHIPVKVTHISASRKTVWFQWALQSDTFALDGVGSKLAFGRAKIRLCDDDDATCGTEHASSRFVSFVSNKKHRLHPFFPSNSIIGTANERLAHRSVQAGDELKVFHMKIMKTFVLMFFSLKLIVLARRAKERMYAPGGSGFVAANENFERAAKRQCM